MLVGRIFKGSGVFWVAEAPLIGVYTQGRSRAEAEEMLADAVQEVVHRDDLVVTITRRDGDEVLIDASVPAALAAYVLKYQRDIHGLSLADVAKALGASSRNAYATYEQGRTEPTLGKLRELLAVVAPETTMIIGARETSSSKRKAAKPSQKTGRKNGATSKGVA